VEVKMSRRRKDDLDRSLLSVRAAVVLALAIFAGLVVGGLSHLAGRSWPESLLAALGAIGGAVALFEKIIERPSSR
jgi:hypothetical protein